MPEDVALGTLIDNIGVVGICLVLFWLFVTDRLVSGRRLTKAENERDRWQGVALEAMGAARVVVPAAETVHRITTHLPDVGEEPAEEAEGAP